MIMERLPGKPLTEAGPFRISPVLLDLQLGLHALDADVLLQALTREERASTAAGGPPLNRDAMTVGGHLAQLEQRVAGGPLDGLVAGVRWLRERRPPERRRRGGPLNPLDASSFGEALAARFARLTGIWPSLPPVP